MSLYICCVWITLVFVQLEGAAVNHRKHDCLVTGNDTSYPSLLITWSPSNDKIRHHRYSIRFWPLYSNNSQESTVIARNSYLAKQLELYTLYKFVVKDITSNKQICEVTARTYAFRKKGHLKITRINSTLVKVSWTHVQIPGADITYKAFMEWGFLNSTNVELVYYGNQTSVMVHKSYIPVDIRFHVNVNVKRTNSTGSAIPNKSATWMVNSSELVLSLQSLGFNFISITWSPINEYNGNVSYSVLIRSSEKRLKSITTTKKNTLTIARLQQNTAYELQLRAHNSSGVVIKQSKWKMYKTLDYDECTSHDDMCHKQAQCINTNGSYYCRCSKGWQGDGHDCQKIPSTDRCVTVFYNGIHWPETKTGQQVLSKCPPGAKGNVTRKCKKTKDLAEWEEPDDGQCVSKDIVDIHDEIQDINSDPVSNAKKLADITKTKQQTYSEDIKLIVSSLDILSRQGTMQQMHYAYEASGNQVNELAASVLNISSGILGDEVIPSWKKIKKSSAALLANKVIQSLDSVALLLARNNRDKREVLADTENIALAARVIPVDEGDIGQWLSPTDDMGRGYASSVYVPGLVLTAQDINHDEKHYISMVTYKTIHKVLQTEATLAESTKVLSPVVSVTLNPLHKNNFEKPVILTITRPKDKDHGEPTCAFLDTSNSSSITWSRKGCKVNLFNDTHTQCFCFHLTSFAVLMKVTDADSHAIEDHHHFALSIISYVGLCTSVVALIVVFLTFTLIRFLNLPRHVIHANLALSLAIAHLTFMFGIDKTESKVLCKSLAVILHYLFLVAFSWMALEGVVLYLMLVKVFNSSISTKKTKLMFVACGWGIPVIIVAVSSAIYHQGYGTRDFCWLSMDNYFIWAFVAPVLAIITFNFVCLGFTFYIMAKNASRNPEKKVDKLRYWVRSCCLLTCILGVTWLLGVFFVNKQTLFMAYLFSFLNGFQGVMIFLLHCVGDRKIRVVYLSLFSCRSKTYGMSSSGGKLGRGGTTKESSSEQKQCSKKRLFKQRTVSTLLRSSAVMQNVEEVKQCNDQQTSVQISNESHGRLTSDTSDTREEIPQSPEKASTPLLKRSRRFDVQPKRV